MIARSVLRVATRLASRTPAVACPPASRIHRAQPAVAQVARVPGMRQYSSGKSEVDATIEELQDLYGTAKDEFEMAMEETEGNTVYAAEDRQAAREEFDKFKAAYQDALKGSNGAEIETRIGQRVRELENAVVNMEELAQNQD